MTIPALPLILLLQTPIAAPEPCDTLKPIVWSVVISATVADVVTTLDNLKQPNIREANPVMRTITGKPAVFVAVQAGITYGVLKWSQNLRRSGYKWESWVVVGAAVVAHGWAAWHNVGVRRDARRLP